MPLFFVWLILMVGAVYLLLWGPQQRRMAMVREFESCASRLDHGWRINLDLIEIHVEVCRNAARAGLLPANLAPETRRLTETSAAYQTALRKRLVAA